MRVGRIDFPGFNGVDDFVLKHRRDYGDDDTKRAQVPDPLRGSGTCRCICECRMTAHCSALTFEGWAVDFSGVKVISLA
jgi:hypothetical protein